MAIYSVAQLRTVPTEQLIREHDEMAKMTNVGTDYYLEELARRDNAQFARQTWWMTLAILGLTIANTLFVAIAALR
jgi:hypothetical protein